MAVGLEIRVPPPPVCVCMCIRLYIRVREDIDTSDKRRRGTLESPVCDMRAASVLRSGSAPALLRWWRLLVSIARTALQRSTVQSDACRTSDPARAALVA